MYDASVFNRVVLVDGALSPEEITFPLVEAISARIWGQGFERPLFANDFTVLSQSRFEGNALKDFA